MSAEAGSLLDEPPSCTRSGQRHRAALRDLSAGVSSLAAVLVRRSFRMCRQRSKLTIAAGASHTATMNNQKLDTGASSILRQILFTIDIKA